MIRHVALDLASAGTWRTSDNISLVAGALTIFAMRRMLGAVTLQLYKFTWLPRYLGREYLSILTRSHLDTWIRSPTLGQLGSRENIHELKNCNELMKRYVRKISRVLVNPSLRGTLGRILPRLEFLLVVAMPHAKKTSKCSCPGVLPHFYPLFYNYLSSKHNTSLHIGKNILDGKNPFPSHLPIMLAERQSSSPPVYDNILKSLSTSTLSCRKITG